VKAATASWKTAPAGIARHARTRRKNGKTATAIWLRMLPQQPCRKSKKSTRSRHPNAPDGNTILGNDKPCSLCEQGFLVLDILLPIAESVTIFPALLAKEVRENESHCPRVEPHY
jgi:hypothetical protein